MGVLRTLLWKNFRWCRRHPFKTALFYVFPLCLCGFLWMVSSLLGVEFPPDCDFAAVLLPPSHPVLVLQSLICAERGMCVDRQRAGYVPTTQFFSQVLTGNTSVESSIGKLCPNLAKGDLESAAQAVKSACTTKLPEEISYRNVPDVSLVFKGQILYYPKSTIASEIITYMAEDFDRIHTLQLGAVAFGNLTGELAEGSQLTDALAQMGSVARCYRCLSNRTFAFDSKAAALEHAHTLDLAKAEGVWALVEFTDTGDHFRYTLAPHFGRREALSTLVLQALVESAVVRRQTGRAADVNVAEKYLPTRCHKEREIYNLVFAVVAILVSLGVVVAAHSITSEICYEKAAGLLEFLFIAGVSPTKVKLAWFLFGLVFLPTVCAMICLIVKYIDPLIMEHTSVWLMLVFFVLYGLALLCLCFLVASVMSTAQKAGVVIIVLLVMAWLPPQWAQILPRVGYTGGSVHFARVLSMLHCSVAAQIGFAYMLEWERVELGAGWANVAESPIEDDRFGGVLEALLHMLVQCPVYMLLSFYFDRTAPSKYGIKLPWYFPFTKAFWCGARDKQATEGRYTKKATADVEHVSDEKIPSIVIEGLTKHYGGVFTALDHLSLTLYKNEITALLGHNGAGKSTSMNMLTGMIMPSEGTAIINGKDIRTEMAEVRKTLGFCPQYDIVYPELTVQEHIRFYGELKGISKADYSGFSNELFRQMKMEYAIKTPAMNLSGGMKRKLSITISFLGNPTTVILDEPTSAIDPFSRRAIWDVVLSYKEKTTCLISTHYMQEADILGDRVAILNHGQLKCCGTTMYLKEKYGTGFSLKLAHTNAINFKSVEEKLREFVPINLLASTKTETTFSISLQSAHSVKMIDAFKFLEAEGKSHGVVSFGISESTMEQVFFRVAADDIDSTDANKLDQTQTRLLSQVEYVNKTGISLLALQFWSVWAKRFHLMKRSKLGMVFQVLMPLLFTVLLLFLNNVIATSGITEDRVLIHPWITDMPRSQVFYAGKNTPLLQSWLSFGMGTRCLQGGGISGRSCLKIAAAKLPNSTADNNQTNVCSCSKCPDGGINVAQQVQLKTADYLINLAGRNISRYLLELNSHDIWGGISVHEMQIINSTDYIQAMPSDIQTKFEAIFKQPLQTQMQCLAEAKLIDSLHTQGKKGEPLPENIAKDVSRALSGYLALMQRISPELHLLWTGRLLSGERRTKQEKHMRYKSQSFLNGYFNMRLRSQLTAGQTAHGISLSTEEVSMTKDGLSISSVFSGIMLGMFSAIALIMPTFTPLLVLTSESSSGNKQLQYLMGLNRFIYWIANGIWDIVLYVFSVVLVVIFMLCFPSVFKHDKLVYFYCCFCFGLGMILASYVLSFLLRHAHVAILLEFIFTPFFAIAALVLWSFRDKSWYETTDTILTALPPYFVSASLTIMAISDLQPNSPPLMDWDVLGKRFVCIGVWCLLMVLVLAGLESGYIAAFLNLPFIRAVCGCRCNYRKIIPKDNDNEVKNPDVAREENDIQNSAYRGGGSVLTVKRLSKMFPNGKLAVNAVSFGVNRNECFGLLGVNGAGKSTLFKMLTGFQQPSAGDAKIHEHSIFSQPRRVARYMSYCPQEDVLFETMTPAEHLHCYGRVRGIPAAEREELIELLISEVGLDAHVGKLAGELSGGNKRKLNFAVAMLDFPDCIFLDEMTTGMDPKARRSAWHCLQKAMAAGCAAVITSHSMEECELLCNRLVIMVNGQFKCIGGVQYLKDKYGKNYSAKFRVADGTDTALLADRIRDLMPSGTRLVEEHFGFLEIEIPAEGLLLSHLYDVIHDMKAEFHIKDFSVSQTTLEHVFVNMVKDQE